MTTQSGGPALDGTDRNRAQQQLINRYFQTWRPWKEIYGGEGLYETIYRQRWDAALALIDGLALPPGSRILEIGCGPGVTTLSLAARGYTVYAIDTVAAMIDSMRSSVEEAGFGGRVHGSLGDLHDLPFAAGYFDAVVIVGVLEWLESWERPLAEIARVMHPAGALVAAANNSWALHRLLDPRLSPLLEPLKRWNRAIGLSKSALVEFVHSPWQARAALRKAGLYPAKRTTTGFGPFSFWCRTLLPDATGLRLHYRLQRWADRGVPLLRSAGYVQSVLARKA